MSEKIISESDMNFSDLLYEKITDAIGCDNPNQFFCMGLPGTMLKPNQYSYDTGKTNASFTGKDLLETPAALAQQLSVLISQRSKIISNINTFLEIIPSKEKTQEFNDSSVDAAIEYFKTSNLKQLETMLSPLRQQLADINRDIDELQQKIEFASNTQNTDVAPINIPKEFTQVIISSTMSSVNKQSTSAISANLLKSGDSLFFGGCSRKSSHSEVVNSTMSSPKDMSIQIGMSVAKVNIEREWFNPCVFLLNSDMYSAPSTHVASNEYPLPCFPSAFLIARDVTIKFATSSAMSSSFAQSVEDHAASGGGFFIFSGSSAKATSSSNAVTVRFTNPQIIGCYLEAASVKERVPISSETKNNNDDFSSIFELVEAFQKRFNDYI